ncbi:DUF1761 domain-containing protein [Candidatus Parcubacteria bacterium]|nr:DUF1761 domain-containing protein [Candidatus Parcubacteria bacterium]
MGVPINYWAVIVATIVHFVIGWLWYGPLFGKKWQHLSGHSMGSGSKDKMMKSMIIMLVGSFLMAYVLAHALVFGIAYTKMGGWTGGVQGAFYYWLGFVAPVTIGVVLWDGKPWKLWFINAGYYLVSLCVMGAILASWM